MSNLTDALMNVNRAQAFELAGNRAFTIVPLPGAVYESLMVHFPSHPTPAQLEAIKQHFETLLTTLTANVREQLEVKTDDDHSLNKV